MAISSLLDDKILLIGIAGETGAGKTTVAKALREKLGKEKVAIIPQDAYQRDRSYLSPEERTQLNYDHPNALENELLLQHLGQLKNEEAIQRPIYDFKTHTRKSETIRIDPVPVIILEGLMVLANKGIRDLLDYKIYVDTDPDVRVLRRLERGIKERGRNFERIKEQYLSVVRPMHLQFVESPKHYADIMIPNGCSRSSLDIIIGKLKNRS